MKSKTIKIGFLLTVFFFFGLFVGCEKKHIDKNLYVLSEIKAESSDNITSWEHFKLTLGIIAQYEKTERIANLYTSQNSLFAADAPKVLPNSLTPEMKIVKFNVKTIPFEEDLTSLLETKTGKEIRDFIKDINTDFGNKYGTVIETAATFHFKEIPKKLIGEDFKIIFSIERKDGHIMADTTKNIHIN